MGHKSLNTGLLKLWCSLKIW